MAIDKQEIKLFAVKADDLIVFGEKRLKLEKFLLQSPRPYGIKDVGFVYLSTKLVESVDEDYGIPGAKFMRRIAVITDKAFACIVAMLMKTGQILSVCPGEVFEYMESTKDKDPFPIEVDISGLYKPSLQKPTKPKPRTRAGKKAKAVAISIILTLLFASSARAINNPADQTSSYGQIPVEFYKICYDAGGSRWFDFGFPMGDKTSNIYFDNWVSKDGESKNFGVQVSKRFPKVVSFTFVNNLGFGSGGSSSSQEAWLDLRWKGGGTSVLLPFENGGDPTFGLRSDKGPLYVYLQYDPSDESFFSGVSYNFRKSGVSLDLAYQEASEITFVRLSKPVAIDSGTLIPEIRTKLGEHDYIGFGLAFVPKEGVGR